MEKPTGKKNKTRTPEAEVHVQKDTAKEEKASGKEQPNQSPTLAQKHRMLALDFVPNGNIRARGA